MVHGFDAPATHSEVTVHEVDDRLHALPPGREVAEALPRLGPELIRQAEATRHDERDGALAAGDAPALFSGRFEHNADGGTAEPIECFRTVATSRPSRHRGKRRNADRDFVIFVP